MNGVRFTVSENSKSTAIIFFLKKTLFNGHWFGDRGPICRYHSLYPTSNIHFFIFRVSIVDGLNYHIPRLYVSINTVGFLGVWVPVFSGQASTLGLVAFFGLYGSLEASFFEERGNPPQKIMGFTSFLWHQDSPQNAAFPHFFWRFHQPFCDYSTQKNCIFFRQQQAIIDIEFVGVMRLLKASNLGKQFFHQTLWLPWTKTYKSKPMHNFLRIWEYLRICGSISNRWTHKFKVTFV